MRSSISAPVLFLNLLFAAVATSAADSHGPTGLVGTWRLISFEDVEGEKIIRRFGDKPLGLFVYTADGHVAIQIANPAIPTCMAPGKKSGPGYSKGCADQSRSPRRTR
jgi:Lipocalin-like domain